MKDVKTRSASGDVRCQADVTDRTGSREGRNGKKFSKIEKNVEEFYFEIKFRK
jgi:hypothetical protein